jgi:hypothetical protein
MFAFFAKAEHAELDSGRARGNAWAVQAALVAKPILTLSLFWMRANSIVLARSSLAESEIGSGWTLAFPWRGFDWWQAPVALRSHIGFGIQQDRTKTYGRSYVSCAGVPCLVTAERFLSARVEPALHVAAPCRISTATDCASFAGIACDDQVLRETGGVRVPIASGRRSRWLD